MKKEYLKPHIKVSTLMYELSLLDGTRGVGGGVTNTGGKDLPSTVGETGEGTDPYGGQGQGTGGGGNRSKAYQVWEN